MPSITLNQACTIIDTALSEGRSRNFEPLAVAVLDAGGHIIAFKREDKASFLRFDLAHSKAWGALGMGFGTRELSERAVKFPAFINALAVVSQGRIVPSPGGVLIVADGEIVGAVGVSGDIGSNDEICAVAGIHAIGLLAKPGIVNQE
jgi:uncharacterized protein GlcG (DUF336 family)